MEPFKITVGDPAQDIWTWSTCKSHPLILSGLLLQERQIKSDRTKSHQTDVQTNDTDKSM